jgi:hypothetical protein
MIIIKKNPKNTKKNLFPATILLFIIIFPIIMSTPLISNYFNNRGKDEDLLGFNRESTESKLKTSSNHPINADDFKYYKTIAIDHTKVSGTENLIDFPILISIFDSDLHDNVQPDGDDIVFAIESQWLDHEIELFNQIYNSTHAKLVAWVRIPFLSPNKDTIIRMYFGNPYITNRENIYGVWNSKFLGVWHLSESSGNVKDSTAYSTSGTLSSGATQGISGQIDGAYSFNNISAGVNIGDPIDGHLDFGTNDFSISFWVNVDQTTGTYQMPIWKGGHTISSEGYTFMTNTAATNLQFAITDGLNREFSQIPIIFDQWMYVVGVVDRSSDLLHVYKDGVEVGSGIDISLVNSISNSYGMAFSQGSNALNGSMDEIRITNDNHSADWISTEYNNQYQPSSFYSVSIANTVYIPSTLDFKYFKEITIDHTYISGSSNLINFPLLISIFDSDLHNETQPDGDDIVFSNGTTWLFHEIELFNQTYNSTHAQLIAWVRIPILSPLEDTILRMYYGNSSMTNQENPNGVWDPNFFGIWHLKESGTGAFNEYFDSSHYGNHGQGGEGNSSFIPTQVVGKIGYAQDFNNLDGYYDLIDCGDDPLWDLDGYQITLQAWIQHDITPQDHVYGIMNHKGWYNGYSLWINYGGGSTLKSVFNLPGDTHQLASANDVSGGTWHYIVATYDGSIMKIFVDGVQDPNTLVKTNAIVPSSSEKGFWIGHGDQPKDKVWSGEYEGQIDEVRISDVARSSDWIVTEYNNQNDPDNFYSITNSTKVIDEKPSNTEFFNYFKMIKVDHSRVSGDGSHSNFPLLISIFDEDLHYDVQSDGDDIAFSLGSVWLDHEIEVFNKNYNSTHAKLVAWVRIPLLSTSLDTYIRMYYGNSTMSSSQNISGVWESSYKGVWHLKEDPSVTPPQIKDSSTPYSNGTSYGVMTPSDQVNGIIDGSLDLDGSNDYIDFSNPSELQVTGELTVQVWFKADISIENDYLIAKWGTSGDFGWAISFQSDALLAPNGKIRFHFSSDGSNIFLVDSERVNINQWYLITVVFKPNEYAKLFLNGTQMQIMSAGVPPLLNNPTVPFRIARRSDTSTAYFDGIVDETRVSNIARSNNWILTEYNNQYQPQLFCSVGEEQYAKEAIFADIQVNAIDHYGNFIPFVNISMFSDGIILQSENSNEDGSVYFSNIPQDEYNFTASIKSDIGNHLDLVNRTLKAVSINESFQTINLICNVGNNLFEVEDKDGIALDSGWIIVGNNTHNLRNCTIDSIGKARFWWVNTTPYEYNYTVYYLDNQYRPKIINLTSGNIAVPNSTIAIQVELTTVDFAILTFPEGEPISGIKIKLKLNDTFGVSIVNLTSDQNGITSLRWLTSSGLKGNYSVQLEYYGENKQFNKTAGGPYNWTEYSFEVINKLSLEFRILISLADFQTELFSLTPSHEIIVNWGSELLLRVLFNVTKAGGATQLLGPLYADLMSYRILLGGKIIQTGNFNQEIDKVGRHQIRLETMDLNSGTSYLIIISAQKSGFSLPSELILQLSVLENELILQQSENDDSAQSVYWLENVDFSVQPYGVTSEEFTIQEQLVQDDNHNFVFTLPDIENQWNISQVIFNIYNISWTIGASDINITIIDPYSQFYMFHASNHTGKNYLLGEWTGISINLNKNSPTLNNNFEFVVGGSFSGTIDIIADVYFIRDKIKAKYVKFNITDTINILSEAEGWAIKEIRFDLFNCYDTGTWSLIDPLTDAHLNITTNEGFTYSLDVGYGNGTGSLVINDYMIYALSKAFLFTIESSLEIIFDVVIKVDYIQEFYCDDNLEELNSSISMNNVNNGGILQINVIDSGWAENYAMLNINGINNGISYFLPSELAMSITIGGQTFSIVDLSRGYGTFSLEGYNKDVSYSAVITANQQVDFTLEFILQYSRTVNYDVLGTISYVIIEKPSINGDILYDTNLGYYLQTIDTSLIDADEYRIRFTAAKEHYISTIKDLELTVLNRLTLINGSSDFLRIVKDIYVTDSFNFTLFYTDQIFGLNISNLDTQYYIWENYDENGIILANGQGILFSDTNSYFTLDFNTEIRSVGNYLLIVTLDKTNYDYKNAMIFLTIKKRTFTYTLGENFDGNSLRVIKGNTLPIPITVIDPTRGNIPLTNATLLLEVNGIEYTFQELGNGSYIFNFPTSDIDAFFTSTILTGKILVYKENYTSQELQISIVIEMEQIFPGIPTFYFILIVSGIIATLGSITTYRVYKKATIPTFVKKTRAIRKIIDADKEISGKLIYNKKEVFVGELVKEKWDRINISLGDILGVKITKMKKPTIMKLKPLRSESKHDLRPIGLIIMRWNERIGTEIISKYPEDIKLSDKTLMQIYSTHEYSGEKGVITLTEGNLNIVSYYSGPEKGYYLILILNFDDDPDVYETGMLDALQTILLNLDHDSYEHMIPALFQRLSLYPTFNYEQMLINIYQNEIKNKILNFLRDDGVILKSELTIWLKDKYLEAFIDLDTILKDLMKMEIIKQISIKGIPSEIIVLTHDLIMLRTPPNNLIKNISKIGLPPSLTEQYLGDVKEFFKNYHPTEADNLLIAKIIMDSPIYETLRLLRSSIVTQNELEKLKKKGVEDIYSVLKVLWDNQMIRVYHDKNNVEYYALLTDFYIDMIFPKYLLNAIKTSYEQKSKANKVLTESLKALEDTYFNMKREMKTK